MYQCSESCVANSGYWDGKSCLNGANPPRIQIECEKDLPGISKMCDDLCENQGGVWANETCTLKNGVELDVCGKKAVLPVPEVIRNLLPGRTRRNSEATESHPQVSQRAEEMAVQPRESTTGDVIGEEAVRGSTSKSPWLWYGAAAIAVVVVLRSLRR